jgi:hypothetical protein
MHVMVTSSIPDVIFELLFQNQFVNTSLSEEKEGI